MTQLEVDCSTTKRCSKCKETKDTVELSTDKSTKDGLFRWCKSRAKELNASMYSHYKANPATIPETKRCPGCKLVKAAGTFSKDVGRPDGLRSCCKSCTSVTQSHRNGRYNLRNVLAGQLDRTGTKWCYCCGETKDKTEFHRDNHTHNGIRSSCKLCDAAINTRWRKDNPARYNANKARRRARKLKATPSWEDKSKTQWYYDESQRISAETGVVHHVDHMVPLNHWSVRGLHWHMNFDVLPGAENMSKGNRFWGDPAPLIGEPWSDWSDYYREFEEEFVQLKEYAKWLKSLTSHARSVHLATLTTSTQLRAKATVTPVATATVTSANERNNEKTCQPSA